MVNLGGVYVSEETARKVDALTETPYGKLPRAQIVRALLVEALKGK
jgi:hypothetical protein